METNTQLMEETKKVKRESDRYWVKNKSEWVGIHSMENAPVLSQSLFPCWYVYPLTIGT